jgi:hypothetical protein
LEAHQFSLGDVHTVTDLGSELVQGHIDFFLSDIVSLIC